MNIGCFYSASTCYSDVFIETLTPIQCLNASLSYSFNASHCESDTCGFSYVSSSATNGMTIEVCLQICTTNGFTYAGLIGV